MSDYKNFGQAGAIGDNARSDNNLFNQGAANAEINLSELANQLTLVRAEMKKKSDANNPDHDEQIGIVASAEKAAKAGDKNSTLSFLKKTGDWTLEVAKSVTAELVKDVIEGSFSA